MKHCQMCNVDVDSAYEFCPLCHNAMDDVSEKTTPEELIYVIKNAKFVVTDSFHGACLAVIFNKPFICLINKVC